MDSEEEGQDLGERSGGLEAGDRGRSPAWGPRGSSLTSEVMGMMTFVLGAVSAGVDLGPDPSWQPGLLPWGGVGSDRGTAAREDLPARSVGAQNYSSPTFHVVEVRGFQADACRKVPRMEASCQEGERESCVDSGRTAEHLREEARQGGCVLECVLGWTQPTCFVPGEWS